MEDLRIISRFMLVSLQYKFATSCEFECVFDIDREAALRVVAMNGKSFLLNFFGPPPWTLHCVKCCHRERCLPTTVATWPLTQKSPFVHYAGPHAPTNIHAYSTRRENGLSGPAAVLLFRPLAFWPYLSFPFLSFPNAFLSSCCAGPSSDSSSRLGCSCWPWTSHHLAWRGTRPSSHVL